MSSVQFEATDPRKSCWVSASAGSGKTKILVDRLLRLLLAGEDMRSIVGFTYTNAAAAEMKGRLQKRLEELASSPDERCTEELQGLLHRPPTRAEWLRARSLAGTFRQQNLRIQTLHSFCKDFLEQFSFSAEIYGTLTVLEGASAQQWLARTQEEAVLTETSPMFLEHFQSLLETMSLEMVEQALQALLAKRQDFAGFMTTFNEDSVRAFLVEKLEHAAGPPEVDLKEISRLAARLLSEEGLPAADETVLKAAAQGRFFQAFLTQGQMPRKKILSATLQKKAPELAQAFLEQTALFVEHLQWERAETLIRQSLSLLHVSDNILQRYQEKKREQHMCDFEDLISQTQQLLGTLSENTQTLEECRRSFPVRHIFLDEAQDTSFVQWKILLQMIHVFFTDASCTVFIVGDVKQSIYSFQGAKPWLFQTLPDVFKGMIQQRGGEFQTLHLQVSYRTAPAILRVVDALFQRDSRGIALGEEYRPHQSARSSEGFVRSVRVEKAGKSGEEVEGEGEADGAVSKVGAVAESVAQEIQGLLEQRLYLPSVGRTLKPEDIFVLSKKRGDLVDEIRQRLKTRGIPAAAPDRLRLSQSLVWSDILTFIDFLVDPYDDYALACLLKSPFLLEDRCSEETLFRLCHGREGTLWDRLSQEEEWTAIRKRLWSYVSESRKAVTDELFFAFFARVLRNLQPAFEETAPEAADVLEGFLEMLPSFLQQQAPSFSQLRAFLASTEMETVTITASTGSPQGVRFSTVHSAKGLQAPVVILADLAEPLTLQKDVWLCLEDEQHQNVEGFLLSPPATLVTPAAQRLREVALNQMLEENRRLLYVALTRAQDGLVVVGPQKEGSWSGLVAQAMENREMEGRCEVERVETLTPKFREPAQEGGTSKLGPLPSRLLRALEEKGQEESAAKIIDEEVEAPTGRAPLSPPLKVMERDAEPSEQALLGIEVHRFLQALAEQDFDEKGALQWFERFSPPTVIHSLRDDPLFIKNLLTLPQRKEFAYMKFGRSEVTLFEGDRLFRVDHLFVDEQRVVVLEVKSTAAAPEHGEEVYQEQLRGYRDLLRKIFPQHDVKAYFVWARHGLFKPLAEERM